MAPDDSSKRRSAGEGDWSLHGWDDEKVYLWSSKTGELCVSDEPELVQRLIEVCVDYHQQRGIPRAEP